MRREEYLHILTEQIRCKMARGTIEQEINDHIEDQKAEFLGEGRSCDSRDGRSGRSRA